MTRITVHPSRQGISLPVTLEHIAQVLADTIDRGLPAGESLTIDLDSAGAVTVTRHNGAVLTYQHPRAIAAAERQAKSV